MKDTTTLIIAILIFLTFMFIAAFLAYFQFQDCLAVGHKILYCILNI